MDFIPSIYESPMNTKPSREDTFDDDDFFFVDVPLGVDLFDLEVSFLPLLSLVSLRITKFFIVLSF